MPPTYSQSQTLLTIQQSTSLTAMLNVFTITEILDIYTSKCDKQIKKEWCLIKKQVQEISSELFSYDLITIPPLRHIS